jgi:peptidoglycan pentaglycine glycine transferase (the first glycine)
VEILKKEDYREYKSFIESHDKGHFMQGYEWAKVKSEWKWEAIIERDSNGKIIGGLSVLIRPVPFLPFTLMYAPRGPVCDIQDQNVLSALFDGIRLLAKKHKAYQFKIDPDVLSSNTMFLDTMKQFGFKLSSSGKNFEGIQPRFVFRMNVSGKIQDEMMSTFHSKTRYNIRVAVKNGVEIKICDKQALDEFLPIMRETGKRDGFPTRPKAYFERMMDAFGSQCRLYMAYFESKPIAGTIAIQYGDKTWYLYGASANEYRNMMPNYLLQWEMIKWSIETNCNIYDFRGVSGDLSEDNPLYGLYRFKKGFNGDFTEFAGEFDLTLNKLVCFAVNNGLSLMKKLRHIKNRRHKVDTSSQ